MSFRDSARRFGNRHRVALLAAVTESSAATKLIFTTQPVGGTSGSTLSTQPVVKAVNGSNVTDTSFTGNVTLSVNTVSGSHALGGTLTVACVAGVATFTNVTDTGSGNATLTANATGLTSATSSAFTTAAAAGNQAIQLAATTGQARTAASVADLVSATGLTFRFRVKGSALIPGASTNRGIIDISDASGAGTTGLKILLALVQNASGVVSCYFNIGGLGLQLLTTFNASAITDPTAWYQGLWTWHPAGTTDKRQCIIWKEGTPAPIVDYHNAIAGSALLTTAGIGVLSFGKTISNIYGSNQTDWDFVALYNNSPYTAIGAGAAVPADPTTGDAGILHLYTFPEGSGTTTADAVAAGPSLSLTNATWEAGL